MGDIASNYIYDTADDEPIDSETQLVEIRTRGRRTITARATSTAATTFVLEVDFGDGTWYEIESASSTSSFDVTRDIAAAKARIRVTTGVAGETASAQVGAA